MSHKQSSNFNIFTTILVSGSASIGQATFTSSATGVNYRDNIGYQINFTGSPQGTLQFNGSNDYNPALPQSATTLGYSVNGNWFTFASVSMASIVSPYALNINQFPFQFIQCQVLSGTSSAVMTGWISTKSIGS